MLSLIFWDQLFSTQRSPPLWAEWDFGAPIQKILKVFPKGNQIRSLLPAPNKVTYLTIGLGEVTKLDYFSCLGTNCFFLTMAHVGGGGMKGENINIAPITQYKMNVSLWGRISLVLALAPCHYKMPSPCPFWPHWRILTGHMTSQWVFFGFAGYPQQTKRFCQTSLFPVFTCQIGSPPKLTIRNSIFQTHYPTTPSSIPPPDLPGFELQA